MSQGKFAERIRKRAWTEEENKKIVNAVRGVPIPTIKELSKIDGKSFDKLYNQALKCNEKHIEKVIRDFNDNNFIDEDNIVKNYVFKFVMAGDAEVGKTSIVNAFVKKKIPGVYTPTIGTDILLHEFSTPIHHIFSHIWDLAGQQTFKSILPMYYKGLDAYIIVFSVTDRESFLNLHEWIIQGWLEGIDIPIIILGNKIDLVPPRGKEEGIQPEVIKEYLDSINSALQKTGIDIFPIHFLPVSAQTSINIEKIFQIIGIESALNIYRNLEEQSK